MSASALRDLDHKIALRRRPQGVRPRLLVLHRPLVRVVVEIEREEELGTPAPDSGVAVLLPVSYLSAAVQNHAITYPNALKIIRLQ